MFSFNSAEKKPVAKKTEKVSVKVPDCATEYVISDPKQIMIQYASFSLCSKMPVALDNIEQSDIWLPSKKFPVDGTLEYLNKLAVQPDSFRSNPIARTIVEYKLGKNSFYMLPTLDIIFERDYHLFMNKEIRKHMAEMIRKYKTLSK